MCGLSENRIILVVVSMAIIRAVNCIGREGAGTEESGQGVELDGTW